MPAKKSKKTTTKKTSNKKASTKTVNKKVKAAPKKKSAAPKKITKKNTAAKSKAPKKKVAKLSVAKKKRVTKKKEPQISSYKPKKNEKYMNDKQQKHFQDILGTWKEQLQIEQDRTADKIQQNVSHFPDESDRATHEEEFTLELRTRERERKLLSKINESIDDLKSDDYGYCSSCGIEIGIRRLEARPTATRCIDCKTIEEIHERQQYG